MQLSQRFLAFLLVLFYSIVLVAGSFFVWSLEQVGPTTRLITVVVMVIGGSWNFSTGMTLDQFLPRKRPAVRKYESE